MSATELFVLKFFARSKGDKHFVGGQCHALLVFVKAESLHDAVSLAPGLLAESGWVSPVIRSSRRLASAFVDIADDVLRGAAIDANHNGFAYVAERSPVLDA